MFQLAIRLAKWLIVTSIIAVASLGGWRFWNASRVESHNSLTYKVTKRNVTDTVIERGTLESQNTKTSVCELPGYQNKIIWILPEGTSVAEGDPVVRFDSADIDRRINEKSLAVNEAEGKLVQAKEDLDIQKNKAESDVAAAELELELAKLDLRKYEEGDFIAEKADLERNIFEGEAELEKVRDELNNMRGLVKKGYRSPEQLREIELRSNSFQYRVDRDKQKMTVLTEFDYVRKMTELKAKADESQRKLERTKTTSQAEIRKAEAAIANAENGLALESEELKNLQSLKDHCEIKAPQSGTIAYANQRWWDPEDRIREGATVYRQQPVFLLPDMSRMQVKVSIHESIVNKIKTEQKAKLRIDAFPDLTLTGTVKFVAELNQSSFSDQKTYETIVTIDSLPPDLAIKPGMTAQVEIMVGTYENVVAIPINALTEHLGQTYVYVREDLGFKRRSVRLGTVTHSFAEVETGLEPGEIVALDAYQRGILEFQADRDDEMETSPIPPVPMGNAPEMD
ncbi:MAG TPA: efflux RND transporter periplasmic adaptor subunit [Pirellulaceae bacterium]|nr:efflux RND transporter periplasmic adaptor subunit [Pirellulaceae bacterium]HMO93340.1 efflux RND transporter periplasmic adaptor subunit [Pirellulaceae bacterium]HMP70111.1 efflux RND transporter periplasmic adaptor subunit [Pirellulaceae bacterium]